MWRQRRWILAQPRADEARRLAEQLRTSPLIAQLLLNRGLNTPDACGEFLRPSLKCLHDPSLMANLPCAAQRIARAIRDREKIVLYGDYDVDGITAVAILWHAIKLLGGDVHYYIPHRIDEGYGLNADAIAQICDDGARLIVSVDCGITAIGPAKVARDRGVDLIITDHHEWHQRADPLTDGQATGEPILPACYAIVHPRLHIKDEVVAGSKALRHESTEGSTGSASVASCLSASVPCSYPNPHLCGAGVAFKLAWGVGLAVSGGSRVNEDFRNFLMEATALAALGTIADVVPLVGENRVLAHFGLVGLKSSRLPGIRALIRSAGLDGQNIDCYHAGFLLAPRLNACGRMGHANLAVQLLTDADPAKAASIASYLEQQNRARQAMERMILDNAVQQMQQLGYDTEQNRAIVLANEGWHAGVIGIVASRIVDRFHRPTIMIALNNGQGQGSGRSISGFHLARALESCAEYLEAYGGHEMAAGLKIRTENFQAFRQAFVDHANASLDPHLLVPELRIDAEAKLVHLNQALVGELARLGPFGHANPRPVLCCRGLTLADVPRRVGRSGDHLQLLVRQADTCMKCIAFGAGELFDKLRAGMRIDLAVEPQLNQFNGRVSVELAVKDIQMV